MKTYTFYREFYSNVPGMEMDLYQCGDLNGSWTSWRSCLLAAAIDAGLVEAEPSVDLITEYELERILIENGVYCEIIED